jgi:eukaryotic-like serine/threonine-protein kinase
VGQTRTQIGRYRIERELGRGAMGVVYKAFDPVVERPLAIKTIRLDVNNREELARRLRREAKSVGQLEHPNIVTLYDAGECEGMFYLAMQYLAGESLWARMQRQQPFSLKETQEILRQISSALDYAHRRGVIHRDVKPANIIVTAENVVKLTDFGIAKVLDATTQTGFIVGTPSYMSPEQALGRSVDGRSDIFSLGTILYELLTGEKAFPGQNVTTVIYKIVHETPSPITAMRPDLCPDLERVVRKSLAKNPDERFQSCAELQMHLDNALAYAAPAIPSASNAPASIEVHSPSPPPASAQPRQAASEPAAGGATSAPASESGRGLAAPSARVLSPWWGVGALGALLLALLVLVALRFKPPRTGAIPPAPPGAISAAPGPAGKSSPAGGADAAGQPLAGLPRQAVGVGLPAQPREGAKPESSRARSVTPGPKAAAPSTPETFDSLLIEGDMAFQSSQYGRALDAYRRAYQIKSNNSEVRRKIATTLTLLGRPDEAQKYQ